MNFNWRSTLITISSLLNLAGSAIALGYSEENGNETLKCIAVFLATMSLSESFLAIPFRSYQYKSEKLLDDEKKSTEKKSTEPDLEKNLAPSAQPAFSIVRDKTKVICQAGLTLFSSVAGTATAYCLGGNAAQMVVGAAAGAEVTNVGGQSYEAGKACRRN